MSDGHIASTVVGGAAVVAPDNWRICDRPFLNRLRFLYALRDFVLQEAIDIPPGNNSVEFSSLNILRKAVRSGRYATTEEWKLIEDKAWKLLSLLNSGQRKRFNLIRSANFLLVIAVSFIFVAVFALIIAVAVVHIAEPPIIAAKPTIEHLAAFLIWLISNGGMGAVAFLYVNALSIQIDPTVDVINRGFVAMRIILGALFAVILCLPYGYESFIQFSVRVKLGIAPEDVKQPALLLMPFILGFSTPLVLTVLNRLVENTQLFFGIKPAQPVGVNDTPSKPIAG